MEDQVSRDADLECDYTCIKRFLNNELNNADAISSLSFAGQLSLSAYKLKAVDMLVTSKRLACEH